MRKERVWAISTTSDRETQVSESEYARVQFHRPPKLPCNSPYACWRHSLGMYFLISQSYWGQIHTITRKRKIYIFVYLSLFISRSPPPSSHAWSAEQVNKQMKQLANIADTTSNGTILDICASALHTSIYVSFRPILLRRYGRCWCCCCFCCCFCGCLFAAATDHHIESICSHIASAHTCERARAIAWTAYKVAFTYLTYECIAHRLS